MSTSSLFRKPFSPKKAPVRKATTISPLLMDAAERSREFGLDYNYAHFQFGKHHFGFDPENGQWYDGKSNQNRFYYCNLGFEKFHYISRSILRKHR